MRPLVAVIIPTFSQTIEQRICLGLSEAFQHTEIEVLFAPVGYISAPEAWQESDLQCHKDIVDLKPSLVIFYTGGLTYLTNIETIQRILDVYKGIPSIHMGQKIDQQPAVLIDNYQGMRDLIHAVLLKKPQPKIAFLSGPFSNTESQLRQQALFDECNAHGVDPTSIDILEGDFTSLHAKHTFSEYWKAQTEKPNIIVCANDLMAKGILDAFRLLGINCPDDCWVTGFDDFEYAQYMTPGLSTVLYPAHELGLKAGRLAIEMLEGKRPQDILLKTRPKLRGSTGHVSSNQKHMRERLVDLWQFIQERDLTSRKFSIVQQIHATDRVEDILPNIQSDLDAIAIDEMFIFKRPSHNASDFVVFEKNPDLTFGEKDLSEHYWVFCPLVTQHLNYGYTLTRCNKHAVELVEFFSPQISEIQHRHFMQSKNDQLRTQNELSERMASLGRLVAGVAHEVNTPVGSGKLAASSLLDDIRQISSKLHNNTMTRSEFDRFLIEMEEHASLIFNSLDRAAELISNFKLVSVDQSVEETRQLALGEYITLIISSLKHEFKHTKINIITDLDASIETITFPGIVAQLLTNVLLNAKQHGFAMGQDEGTIHVSLKKAPEGFKLSITDNGKGVNEDALENMFEPFYTTARAQGGSGLGMYIVYNIANQKLNWDIHIKNQPKKGFAIAFTPKKDSFA
ncbi:substrate-binding domain-containing protein [Reinekea forsetii]|nr:substrate-binding domain-containing protein [Reinekea forsetii]